VPRTSDEYRTGGVPERAYVDQDSVDDVRILVDRPWPRSVRKQDLARDAWPKDVAPSVTCEPSTGTIPSGSKVCLPLPPGAAIGRTG
jgi:hypothetical protein